MPATSSSPGSYSQTAQARGAKKVARRAVKTAAHQTAQAVTMGAGTATAAQAVGRAVSTGISAPSAPSYAAARRARRIQRQERAQKRAERSQAHQINHALKNSQRAQKALTKSAAHLAKQIEAQTGAKVARPKVRLGDTNSTKHNRITVTPRLARQMLAADPIAEAKTTRKLAKLSGQPPPKQPQRPQQAKRPTTLPGLDRQQTKVATKVLRQGEKAGATKKELLAAAETALVESNVHNLPGGDADSAGWRQERASLYPDPTNVKHSAQRFFAETASAGHGKGITAGELAANVQRPAAQYRGRYDEAKAQAKPIVKAFLSGKSPPAIKQLPGPYDGAKEAVLRMLPKNTRAEGRSDKRTPAENAAVGGSPTSDHLTTNKAAYAADIPPDPKVYATLRKRLGLAPAKTGMDSVTRGGYRYQLIFGAQYNHADHIHLGAEWTGAASTPTVSAGGASSSPAYSATTMTVAAKSKPGHKRRPHHRRKAKIQEGRQRSKFIRSLIANPPPEPAPITAPTSAYDTSLNRKVTLDL